MHSEKKEILATAVGRRKEGSQVSGAEASPLQIDTIDHGCANTYSSPRYGRIYTQQGCK